MRLTHHLQALERVLRLWEDFELVQTEVAEPGGAEGSRKR